LNLFRERLGQIPSLLVDTGYFTADERSAHGKLRPDVVTKNDWALRAYSRFLSMSLMSPRTIFDISPTLSKNLSRPAGRT
jgi:hypothetical protein